jgi:hypothetical protein
MTDELLRRLSEDYKSWYFHGTERYEYKLKEFSFDEVDELFTKKVEEYLEFKKGLLTGKITEAERIRKQNELAKHIFTNAFENFGEEDWQKLAKDKKLGRGGIIRSMEALWGFLAEVTNSTEAKQLQMQFSMMP